MKFEEIYPGSDDVKIFATSKNWRIGLSDNLDEPLDIPVGLYCSAINMYEATGEKQFKAYPYYIEIEIMVAKPNKKFYEGDGEPDALSLIEDTHSYMGGVPVTHHFIRTDAINKKLIEKLKSKDAKIMTENPQFGTVAAQLGRGAEFSYPVFKTAEGAEKFLKDLVRSYGDVMLGMMVGFILDGPINMVGETGWSVMEYQVTGERQR